MVDKEINQAGLKRLPCDVSDAKPSPADTTEEVIGNYLYTSNLPKMLQGPTKDSTARAGVSALSLPWQSAYSEFTDILWPDFDEKA